MKRKNLQIFYASIGTLLYTFFIGLTYKNFGILWQVGLISSIPIIMGIFFYAIHARKEKLYKLAIIVIYFALLSIVAIAMVIRSKILADIKDPAALAELIRNAGTRGKFIFVLIQFLQVTFVPIPSTIVSGAGALIFVRSEAILLSTLGLMLGSFFAFILGRIFGVKLVKWIAGEEQLKKYYQMVKGRDKLILYCMFLLPVFPDDLLCLIAGLTNMTYFSFFMIQILSRPLNVAVTVYMVDILKVIPLSGWGLVIWGVIGIFAILAIGLFVKNANKLEEMLMTLIRKITRKNVVHQIEWKSSDGSPIIKDTENFNSENMRIIDNVDKVKLEDIMSTEVKTIINNTDASIKKLKDDLYH